MCSYLLYKRIIQIETNIPHRIIIRSWRTVHFPKEIYNLAFFRICNWRTMLTLNSFFKKNKDISQTVIVLG